MSMRLLPKSDVFKAKASAQKRDIDEGAKIARRVDNLRELAVQEEESLTKFRVKTIAQIHAETKEATQERDRILVEVKQLRRERTILQQPLDKEWDEISKAKQVIQCERDEALQKAVIAQEAERQAKKAIKQATDSLLRSDTRETVTSENLHKASRHEREAKLALQNARKVEAKALKLSEAMKKELAQRDADMASKERGYTMKVAKLKERESALEKEWALLEDRKLAFERRIKRPKK